MSGTTDFTVVVEVLRRHGAGWCVIGGMAVNAYVRPVYTADLDMVVVTADLAPVLADLRAADFRIKEFPHSINAQRRAGRTERASHMLMVQFSKAEEYQSFVDRAVLRPLLGLDVPVASPLDLAQGKLLAWGDPLRREAKRSKDESDLLRLGEEFSEVYERLPAELRVRLDRQRQRAADSLTDGWGDE